MCERGIEANFRCRPLVVRRRLRDGQLPLFFKPLRQSGKSQSVCRDRARSSMNAKSTPNWPAQFSTLAAGKLLFVAPAKNDSEAVRIRPSNSRPLGLNIQCADDEVVRPSGSRHLKGIPRMKTSPPNSIRDKKAEASASVAFLLAVRAVMTLPRSLSLLWPRPGKKAK